MFSDYCPIISAEVSKGDAIEFFSDRNEEKVSIPFWMYYPSAEVHRACRLASPAAGVSPARIVQSGTQQRPPIIWYQVILSLKVLFIHIIAI